MTAPERLWNALHLGKIAAYSEYQLTRHTEGAKEKYCHAVEEIEAAMDIHQAALDRIAELEGELRECVEVLALKENPDFPDPKHHERVKALGQEIGFGALMSTASCGWRECAKEQGIAGSEFVAGPCYVTVVETLSRARAVLAKGDG